MHKRILKSILSLILCLCIIFSVALTLVACSASEGNNGSGDNNPSSDIENDYHDKIVVPEYKDYQRGTINFKDISYTRPNYTTTIENIRSVIAAIEKNEISFDEQIERIIALEDEYNHILTMYSLANIYNSKDTSLKFWNTEYTYVASNYPLFAEAIEDLFVAAANSTLAEKFEEEYFGEGLIEKYRDGGKFTEAMIELWANEEQLEAEYSSISTDSVEITYNGITDTLNNLLDFYKQKYGESSREYLSHSSLICTQYREKLNAEYLRIFISLIKTRKEIARELGNRSYLDYAYESLGRDYTSAEASKYLDDISEYIVPVYNVLYLSAFIPYFYPDGMAKPAIEASGVTLDVLINNGYDILEDADSGLTEIYAYMLQHGLYDIELNGENRMPTSFTTYLDQYNAPFVFISALGNITDYSTLFHEFGHFYDSYINYNSEASIDQKEISSQGLEYLMLHFADEKISKKDQVYLKYSMLRGALETLVIQGFYAKSEELIYALDYDDITKENIDKEIKSAADMFGLNSQMIDVSYLYSIPHLYLYPFYVQSYAVSIAPALEMYFMEKENPGTGFEAYLELVDRTGEEDLTLKEALKKSGLTDPFKKNYLRTIANDIYNAIIGKSYYEEDSVKNDINVA